ncbi:hypothetical protein [Halalkalicoccus tibetensis]|uniref:Uncharacterized protein n=1 Tax=Halalkalicoccus tibetensis TaxID=175632 RepID=A0ABD5V5G0_9EURY
MEIYSLQPKLFPNIDLSENATLDKEVLQPNALVPTGSKLKLRISERVLKQFKNSVSLKQPDFANQRPDLQPTNRFASLINERSRNNGEIDVVEASPLKLPNMLIDVIFKLLFVPYS